MDKMIIEKYYKAEIIVNKYRSIEIIAELNMQKENEGRKLSMFGEFRISRAEETIQRYDKMLQYMEAADRSCIYILVNGDKDSILPYEIGDAIWHL